MSEHPQRKSVHIVLDGIEDLLGGRSIATRRRSGSFGQIRCVSARHGVLRDRATIL
jgi:hypothetical protein